MRLIELFCGAGGMSLGFKRAGFTLLRGYDFWAPALAIHEANLGSRLSKLTGVRKAHHANLGSHDAEMPDLGDILTLAPKIAALTPDIIVGGPPCQPWSAAGARLGEADARARLTDAFLVIVATARPRYFVMENVPGIRRYGIFDRLKTVLRRAGYGLTETIVNAAHYGVAQRRKRLILAGCLGEADGWLLDHLAAAESKDPMTVADVLGPDFGKLYFRLDHDAGERRSLWQACEAAPAVTSTSRKLAGQDGYSLREADIEVIKELSVADRQEVVRFFWLTPGGQSSAGSRRADRPAPTISHGVRAAPVPSYEPKAGDVIDHENLPIPTFAQLSLIGGFPPSWDWSPVRSEADRMQALANAVPPPLAEAIGRCIMAHSKGERPVVEMKVPPAFKSWLRKSKKLTPTRRTQIVSEFKAVQRFLGKRVFDGLDPALAALDQIPEFRGLSAARKSNLRAAARLYAECSAHLSGS